MWTWEIEEGEGWRKSVLSLGSVCGFVLFTLRVLQVREAGYPCSVNCSAGKNTVPSSVHMPCTLENPDKSSPCHKELTRPNSTR